jgi:aminoglycoside/choline kinase family phosphotransferase
VNRDPGAALRAGAVGLDALIRATGLPAVSIVPLPGDVGRRRYFRLILADNRSVLGVVYPGEEQDSRRRWAEARALLAPSVRVPALIADDGLGNQIVEDLGSEDLAARFAVSPVERPIWLGRAADAAAAIARLPDPGINPAFDGALLGRELDLAREAVFEMFLGAPLSPAEREAHDAWRDALVREVLGHPFVLCHRDFHANNLFPLDGDVALIDFQDLRAGPDSYDIASLLWERTTLDWMNEAAAREVVTRFAASRGVDAEAFAVRLRRVLLQRAWKVCGTFARAAAAGKADVYRRYLPAELALVRGLLSDSAEDSRFRKVLEGRTASVC